MVPGLTASTTEWIKGLKVKFVEVKRKRKKRNFNYVTYFTPTEEKCERTHRFRSKCDVWEL